METQAEAFLARPKKMFTRDWDVMYRDGFDGTLWKAGISIRAHLPQSPNLQAYVERLVQTIQQECLDHFVILGQRHFDHLISEFVEYSLKHRPHQALANLPLGMKGPPPEMATVDLDHIVRHETLGGLLKRYERREPKERPPTAGPLAPQAGHVFDTTP